MRLRERWSDLPIRLRAGLAALFLVLTFLLLWWLSGWAWPTPTLAHRALEREHLFGRGEIVAEGEITHSEDASHSSGQGTHFVVSKADGRYAASVLRPKWGFLWRSAQAFSWPFFVLSPTEEAPLAYSFLASDSIYTVNSGSAWISGWDYLLLVVSDDPDIVRVEVTMNYTYRLSTGEGYGEPMESDPVTAQAQPVADGVWLARVQSPDPLEGRSGGYSANYSLRGYDAAGQLIYDSGPQ